MTRLALIEVELPDSVADGDEAGYDWVNENIPLDGDYKVEIMDTEKEYHE